MVLMSGHPVENKNNKEDNSCYDRYLFELLGG